MAPLHPTCPTDDMLGALVHRALAPKVAQVTAHLDECPVCQQIVLATVRGHRSTQRTVPMASFSLQGGLSTGVHASGGHSERHDPALLAIFRRGAPSIAGSGAHDAPPDLPRYDLRAVLGSGGMGTVYDAYDPQLGRPVALKVLRPELSATPGLADRLVRESRVMAKLAHPSVITVYDVGRANGDPGHVFIAMEQIQGSTLTAWLAAHELSWRAIVPLFERAGQGLAAAHSAGIVHRNFKPANVLVSRDGQRVVVTDFGIAREADSPDERLAFGSMEWPRAVHVASDTPITGTPAYLAPEQVSGRSIDPRADVFAFSVALWEAVFHGRPFPGETVREMFAAMQRPPVRATTDVRVPRRLVRALRRGLALEPRDRWPDMPALLAELAAIRSFRRRAVVPLGAAGLIGLGIATALLVVRDAPAIDPCAVGLASLDAAYAPALDERVAATLAGEPQIRDDVRARLRTTAAAWRTTHQATCRAGRAVAQDAKTTACLEARRLELAAAIDDMIAGGPAGAKYATRISRVPGDPAACTTPAPGQLFARVPSDPGLRRAVTALRNRLADAELARDRSDVPRALAVATETAAAAARVWPPVHAEAQYALGRILRLAGDRQQALATLGDAVVVAERAHRDDVVVSCWLQLAFASVFDGRGLYPAGSAAEWQRGSIDGRGLYPAGSAAEWQRGSIDGRGLYPAGSAAEWQRGSIDGRGLYPAGSAAEWHRGSIDGRGLYPAGSAAEWHRGSIDGGDGDRALEYVSYAEAAADRLGRPRDIMVLVHHAKGTVLAALNRTTEGETELDLAIGLAEATHSDALAHVLQGLGLLYENQGRDADAVATYRKAIEHLPRSPSGEVIGSPTFYERLAITLSRVGQPEQAEVEARHAIAIAVRTLPDSQIARWSPHVQLALILQDTGRYAEALAEVTRAVAALEQIGGRDNGGNPPQVADALRVRGAAHAALGNRRAAIGDFERAIAIFQTSALEPGYLADAKWRLGQAVWPGQPARARAEIRAAVELFGRAARMWSRQREAAATWLTHHDPVQHRR